MVRRPGGADGPPAAPRVHLGRGVIHSTHKPKLFRGLWYCRTCGFYSDTNGNKADGKALRDPCKGPPKGPKPTGRRNLDRISRGLHPRSGVALPPDVLGIAGGYSQASSSSAPSSGVPFSQLQRRTSERSEDIGLEDGEEFPFGLGE